MAAIKLSIPVSRDVLVPAHSVNLLLDRGDGNVALLYIYILSHSGELDIRSAKARLNFSEEEIMRGLGVLSELGLVGKTETVKLPERSDEIPEYSQTDVAEHIGSDRDFKYLVGFCEETLGKLLSTVDLQVLLGIYSWLGLPVDVICLLVTSALSETRKKFGAGRVPTMRTIEKKAKLWVRNGVVTLGQAEEFLREQEKLGEDKARLAAVLRITGRELSPTEERYISEWLSLGIPDELVLAAYDKTVVNTGALKWSYMNKILTSWRELGYTCLADIENGAKTKTSAAEKSSAGDERAAMKLRELNRKKRKNLGE